jgi:hypothetical protein
MLFIAICLTILFNICIFPTEFILRILHGIKIDIKSILFWIKKKPTKEVIMQTLDSIENKVKVQQKPLTEEDINKMNQIQQADGIDFNHEEIKHAHICCCFLMTFGKKKERYVLLFK